jgi:hypothetical protein
MSAPVTVSERCLRVLAGMVSEHRADLPAQGLPTSLLSDLMSQIRRDAILFAGYAPVMDAAWYPAGGAVR